MSPRKPDWITKEFEIAKRQLQQVTSLACSSGRMHDKCQRIGLCECSCHPRYDYSITVYGNHHAAE